MGVISDIHYSTPYPDHTTPQSHQHNHHHYHNYHTSNELKLYKYFSPPPPLHVH